MPRAAPRPARKAKITPTSERAALVFRDFVRQLEKLAEKPAKPKQEGAR